MATIAILEHELQRGIGIPYMIYAIAERWRAAGHRILVHQGLDVPPPADVAINNIDLTIVPPEYRELFARYARVINGAVLDVSKSRFSRNKVDRGSDWRGPVIVKTESNFGGKPEALFRSVAQRRRLRVEIPQGPVAEGYPVYRSLQEVPDVAWSTPGLLVERFLPEKDERGYYLRIWSFLGDREYSARWRAEQPVVKSENFLERETVEVPDEIRVWREKLDFDYGRFDYVRHGERFELLDVNRTSTASAALLRNAGVSAGMDVLAEGLASFLGSRGGV